MPVEVIVKLAATATGPAARRALDVCARDAGVTIAPLHAGADGELASYYVTFVEPGVVGEVIARFSRCDGVEAAYAKPSAEPPAGRM